MDSQLSQVAEASAAINNINTSPYRHADLSEVLESNSRLADGGAKILNHTLVLGF